MEVRANFPLSVSGFALDTSPLKGWRKGMNSPRSAPFLTPFRALLWGGIGVGVSDGGTAKGHST